METSTNRVRAKLGIKKNKMTVLLLAAKAIYTKMVAAVQQFPSPVPTMVALLTLIQSFELSQIAVSSRTKGASTQRAAAAKPLIYALEQLLTYVQSVADASPDTAAAIIAAAGMYVCEVRQPLKAPLTVTNGKPSGTVILRAFAKQLTQGKSASAFFSWQFSSDERSWTSLPSTTRAATTITGLTPATVVYARVAVTVGTEPMSAWSPPVSLIVA